MMECAIKPPLKRLKNKILQAKRDLQSKRPWLGAEVEFLLYGHCNSFLNIMKHFFPLWLITTPHTFPTNNSIYSLALLSAMILCFNSLNPVHNGASLQNFQDGRIC